MFMDKKTQYYQVISSSQLNLQIQPQSKSRLVYGYGQTDSKVVMDKQETQNIEY